MMYYNCPPNDSCKAFFPLCIYFIWIFPIESWACPTIHVFNLLYHLLCKWHEKMFLKTLSFTKAFILWRVPFHIPFNPFCFNSAVCISSYFKRNTYYIYMLLHISILWCNFRKHMGYNFYFRDSLYLRFRISLILRIPSGNQSTLSWLTKFQFSKTRHTISYRLNLRKNNNYLFMLYTWVKVSSISKTWVTLSTISSFVKPKFSISK